MKVGLFFGSFNPIHIGHLIIANTVLTSTSLQEIWFVVSPQNPFKSSSSLLHHFDRYEMVRLAIDDNPGFRVSDIEFNLPKPGYTIDTLTYLQEKHPGFQFSLILGEDNLTQFSKWKNHQAILELFDLYYYKRPKSGVSQFHDHPKVNLVVAPLLEISATFIRQSIKEQRSIKYLVPEIVEQYIKIKKFYL